MFRATFRPFVGTLFISEVTETFDEVADADHAKELAQQHFAALLQLDVEELDAQGTIDIEEMSSN